MSYLIGIDIGTSATKTILMDEGGNVIAQASRAYPLYRPHNGWAEQDPEDWKRAALDTLKQVVRESGVPGEEIRGIGLSGQMHGLVMLDEENQLIGPSIIWCDQRSVSQVDEMQRLLPYEKWLEITANPPIAAWTAAKILWVRENKPEQYSRCRHILLPKDYVRFVLTGKFATDVSDASGMQLLDVKNRCWSDEVLQALQIDRSLLGTVYESKDVTGYLLPEIAAECGLTAETAVVGGSADNAGAAIGTGAVRDGDAFTSLGTSALVYTAVDRYTPIPEGSLHLCCSSVPGAWFTMGGPQAAGLSVEWFRENFCQGLMQKAEESGKSIYELLNEETAAIQPGSDHLIYMPSLMGERTPHMNPKSRGAFVGLNVIHTPSHLMRAVMEGITYSLADCNNILKDLGVSVTEMRVCGGGSKNPVWRQIMADLYDCNVIRLKQEEGPAYGAAILAGVGAGVFQDVRETSRRFARTGQITEPIAEEIVLYRKYHKIYDNLYEHMTQDFNDLYDLTD
ncbi:MAG: xylulokinase [Enterocloster sp.]